MGAIKAIEDNNDLCAIKENRVFVRVTTRNGTQRDFAGTHKAIQAYCASIQDTKQNKCVVRFGQLAGL